MLTIIDRFGPNSFPANNSALFACETQVVFAVKSLFAPIVDRRTLTVEVEQSAEEKHTNVIQQRLKGTVFSGDCSNWYIGKHGRNAASWPAKAANFWFETYFPDWNAFTWANGSVLWPVHWVTRWLKVNRRGWCGVLALLGMVAYLGSPRNATLANASREQLRSLQDQVVRLI